MVYLQNSPYLSFESMFISCLPENTKRGKDRSEMVWLGIVLKDGCNLRLLCMAINWESISSQKKKGEPNCPWERASRKQVVVVFTDWAPGARLLNMLRESLTRNMYYATSWRGCWTNSIYIGSSEPILLGWPRVIEILNFFMPKFLKGERSIILTSCWRMGEMWWRGNLWKLL